MTMKMTMRGWVVTTFALTAVLAIPSDGQSQTSPNIQMAVEREAEASRFLDKPDQWVYAANLYWAAAQIRADDDPQGQEDLRIAASLVYESGNAAGAITVLESAGSRALASGDVMQAADILTDAVWVANKAGLRNEQRRLSSRVVHLADSSQLTPAEKRKILSRFGKV